MEIVAAVSQGPRESRGPTPKGQIWPMDMSCWSGTELISCFYLFLFCFVSTGSKSIQTYPRRKEGKGKGPRLLQRHRKSKRATERQDETAWAEPEEGRRKGRELQQTS